MDITTIVLNQTKTLRTTRNVMKLSERPRSRNYTTDPRDNVNQIFHLDNGGGHALRGHKWKLTQKKVRSDF